MGKKRGGGGVTFSRGGGRNIYIKNKLKYEILYSMAKKLRILRIHN